MSAIAGILRSGNEPVSIEESDGMMRALQKYPADDVHTWQDGPVFLGCHARWITPESVYERLPYYDGESKLAITADAIIDNREELFERLQIGTQYRSAITDSELIMHAYQKWGKTAPQYLIGDFAFVIWDERQRLLFGARDLAGNRTFYYHSHPRFFAFCTAINPLFSIPGVKKELEEQWLADFLTLPGMAESMDISATVYKDINQIPPAHIISVSDGIVSLSRYGSLLPEETLRLKSDGEYVEAFQQVFQEAVRTRLRTHREVGASLSGGLDSGAVVSFAVQALKEQGKTLHTYSYVPVSDFDDWTPKSLIANERPYIETTVRHVGNISDHYLDCAGHSPLSEVTEWLDCLETPYKYFENSFWIKEVYEMARQQGVGVLLTGARGNFTISWGPALEYYAMLLKQMAWIRLYRECRLYSEKTAIPFKRLLSMVGKRAFPSLSKSVRAKDQPDTPPLIHPEFARRTGVVERLQDKRVGVNDSSFINEFEVRKSKFENLSIANKNGAMATKLSLRYGLWERDPTSDLRVIRFCLSVPIEQYVRDGMDRALIRRSTRDYLPDKVRLNQRIRGVQPADWVHRMIPSWNSFIGELQSLTNDRAVSEMLNIDAVKTALSKVGEPKPADASNPDIRFLMRSLIVYRFIKNFHQLSL